MKWLRPDEAAHWLGVQPSNLYAIASREHWRRRRVGRHVEYALDDVNATLDARTRDDALTSM